MEINFYILILYSITEFAYSNSFSGGVLQNFLYVILYTNRLSCFCLYDLSGFYFSCLIALARMSSTVLNKNGESGNPFFVTDLRRKLLALYH